ncbi:hypothetical protein TruAng_008788 [Truncatella angustata]|nr:hypothetical protein TruAng_008788 [Truncatella angustata]
MTPFHAMGMITGLEDVRVFFRQFRDEAAARVANGKGLPPIYPTGTIADYTAHRLPDVHSIVDLAHEHYYELRHGFRSPGKRARKVFDHLVSRWLPFLDWTTLYARIQFGNDRFSDVVRKEKLQDKVIHRAMTTATALLFGSAIAGVYVVAKPQILLW